MTSGPDAPQQTATAPPAASPRPHSAQYWDVDRCRWVPCPTAAEPPRPHDLGSEPAAV